MTRDLREELGQYRGRIYHLHARCDPGFNNPEEFAVTIYYKNPEREETIEVARVDTAHGDTHIDKLWRPSEPSESVDWGVWEAMSQLKQNWRRYADRHEKNR